MAMQSLDDRFGSGTEATIKRLRNTPRNQWTKAEERLWDKTGSR
jgi:hypothetical protein